MKRGQIAILVFAALAVALIASAGGGGSGGGDDEKGGGSATPQAAKAPAGALRVTFPYSPEKKPLLEPLIERFNASKTEVAGKAVFVEGDRSPRATRSRRSPRAATSPSRGRPPRRCGGGC